MLNFISEFFTFVFIALLLLFLLVLKLLIRDVQYRQWKQAIIERKQKKETQQSLEELGYPHSENYAYIASTTPLWVRLRLSKHRGDRKALYWRIKLLQLLNIVGPKTAGLLLEEYMITAETPVREATSKEWSCSKCGTHNPKLPSSAKTAENISKPFVIPRLAQQASE